MILQALSALGAPVHQAREAVELLRRETPDFIPPSLLGLGRQTVPTSIPLIIRYGAFSSSVSTQGKFKNVKVLRQRILQEWNNLDQSVIDSAVKQWRQQLSACIVQRAAILCTHCKMLSNIVVLYFWQVLYATYDVSCQVQCFKSI